MQTTINDFLDMEIKEFKKVESFTSFIERSYTNIDDFEFIKYKFIFFIKILLRGDK